MSTFGPVSYNIDINQLGASQYPRFSISQPTPYQDGLVEDVILNETHPLYAADGNNVGMVQVRFIPGDRGTPKEQLNWAAPLDATIREYPLKNELVLVFYSLGRLFYTRRINSTNKVTESSWPGLGQRFSIQIPGSKKSEAAVMAAQGGTAYQPSKPNEPFTLGNEFRENPSVRMVRPNEGDLIIEGRFGNTIRFGSSLFSEPNASTLQPNILLSAGQSADKVTSANGAFGLAYEDINKDKSIIWMVTDEKVTLIPATINSISHLRSSELSDSTKYTGAQIFINSDRLILNSRLNEISMFSNTEINLSAVQSITIDSAKSVMITGEQDITLTTPRDIVLTGRTISFNSINDISQGTSGNYIISGKKIFIGASPNDTTQPMVLGGELANWLQKLMDAFIVEIPKSIATLNPGPFVAAITQLRIQLGLPSVPQSAIFNSTSNFTSKTNN